MPELERPDGVRIHWDERGSGPLIVMATQFFGLPSVFEALIAELAQDNRVVTYDIRGTGASTRQGPYELETDAHDLAALVEDLDEPALVIAVGDGTPRAIRAAAEHTKLITAVLNPGGNPVGLLAAQGTDTLAASGSVLEALVGMMDTDYRGALRTIVSSGNPQLDEAGVRDRVQATVENCPRDAASLRLKSWITMDVIKDAQALGGRVWILDAGPNPWFPSAASGATPKVLPEAHIHLVEDGPLSRPDIAASYARRILSPEPVGGSGPDRMDRVRTRDPS